MFFIPGVLISALTFPGVIIHEWAHKFFCERMGVVVHKVKYFQLKNPAGYVMHEAPKTYAQTFWISIGPLIVNSLAAIILSLIATQTVSGGWFWLVLYWIAISAGMHSFPSDHDMKHVASASTEAIKKGGNILHYLAFPFVWLVWIANKLRFFWFDLIWAGILVSIGGGFTTIDNAITSSPVNSSGNGSVIVGEYTCPSYAASQADSMRATQTFSNQVDSDENYASVLGKQLSQLSDTIDNDTVDHTVQTDIDRHNQMVENYNTRLATYKSAEATYKSELEQYNSQVTAYNNYLEQHCTRN